MVDTLRNGAVDALAASNPDIGEQIIANLRLIERRATTRQTWDAWWEMLDGEYARATGDQLSLWAAILQKHGGLVRVKGGVLVASSALVEAVFLNEHDHYTVSGYARRTRASFGLIYLGLDAGARYDDEATKSNAAIMRIARADAFDRAYRYAAEALSNGPVLFNVLVENVLARLCKDWFDLPDEVNVMTGSTSPGTSFTPARCPGHYDAPSGNVFRPDPPPSTKYYGMAQSTVLRKATDRYVANARAGNPPRGSISSALFDTFPDTKSGNEKLSAALIGVMLGFLPTTKFNLLFVMRLWMANGAWSNVVSAYGNAAGTSFERAADVIEPALRKAIQLRPQPGAVWRTVARRHTLGSGACAETLRPGERVAIWIEGAMLENLLNGDSTIFPVFGGDRRAASAPRHACPGYEAAMGVMLGLLAADVESNLPKRVDRFYRVL